MASDDEDGAEPSSRSRGRGRLAYDPEQESLRRALKAGGGALGEESDEGEEEGGGLLTKKPASAQGEEVVAET